MELKQLQNTINEGEGLRIEFKEAIDSVPKSFYETVVSFSNTDGGTILLGVDDNRIVKGIDATATVKEVLLYLVSGWHQKGTQLSALDWPENQIHEKTTIEKAPSWSQKSTQLLRKKSGYLISILSLCTEPIKMSQLLEIFNYKNEKLFRDNYLKPLRAVDFIRFTIPEKPTDPDNKYVITEQGKAFLTGQF